MKLSDMSQQAGQWLSGSGPMHDVVISSRVRLARNIAGMPFLGKCTDEHKTEIVHKLKDAIFTPGMFERLFFVDVAACPPLDRELLVERHLISRQHSQADHPRAIIINDQETISLMINEEDHLRMQVLRSGLYLHEAFNEINNIDDKLCEKLNFAFSGKYGYLTACPTNVGSGLRVSVMLHLPALKLSGEINRAMQATQDLRLAIRGLYGEGTESVGDFYQISNQLTLGQKENEIVDNFINNYIPEILTYERNAREALLTHNRLELEDKIGRAMALVQSARLMCCNEALQHLSLIRLGINLGILDNIDLHTVNELVILTRPAHLQKLHGSALDSRQRDENRSKLLKSRIGSPPSRQ